MLRFGRDILCCSLLLSCFIEVFAIPVSSSIPPEPWYGDFVGSLPDPQGVGIQGDVYIVNDTCIQILNFTYGGQAPDLYFWLDKNGVLSSRGARISTFEYGDTPLRTYENARVVLVLPDDGKVTDFKSFGLWCQAFAKEFGYVLLPEGLSPPKVQFLDGNLRGTRYNVGSGPILVMDRRTVKVYGFTYDGKLAPDGYFYVGRGSEPRHDNGVKVPIRGRDKPDFLTAMRDVYRGGQDLILELPEGYDIYNIDWLSVYCVQFRVDFGHLKIGNLSVRIPPYVPLQKRKVQPEEPVKDMWPMTTLLGRPTRTNFTFQLGPPGGRRGYQALAEAHPGEYVWYVNGFMTPELWLQRGVTYTFIVEGGADATAERFDNPLYITSDPFGGYMKLSAEDRRQVTVYAGVSKEDPMRPAAHSSGRLCLWAQASPEDNPDNYNDFTSYRKTLRLNCLPGEPGIFQWTPDRNTTDNVYYQSFTGYNMGWKIMVVDDIPAGLPDVQEEPYKYELWLEGNLITQVPRHQEQKDDIGHPENSASNRYLNSILVVISVFLCRRAFLR